MLGHNGGMCIHLGCYLGHVTTNQPPTLGQVLYRLRTEMDWSRDALAHRSRVSPATIQRIENEIVDERTQKPNIPKPGTLRKLAVALGHHDSKRIEEVRRELFDAAGYGEAVLNDGRTTEVEELRRRVALLETRLEAEPLEVEQIRRILAPYTPEQRQAFLRLVRETLEQQQAPVLPSPPTPGA